MPRALALSRLLFCLAFFKPPNHIDEGCEFFLTGGKRHLLIQPLLDKLPNGRIRGDRQINPRIAALGVGPNTDQISVLLIERADGSDFSRAFDLRFTRDLSHQPAY